MFYENILTLNLLKINELYFCHVLNKNIQFASIKRLMITL